MAKTLLQSVNAVLRRVGVIQGESGNFSSLTDTARQRDLDVAVDVINEGLEELYSLTPHARPKGVAESTISLLASTRGYSLASDIVRLRWPMIDKTNTQFIYEFKGGYEKLLQLDPEQDDEGLPLFGALDPTDGKVYLDRAPSSENVGAVYTYQYDKDISLSTVSDTVPFTDAAWRAMVPVWVQLWRRDRRGQDEFDTGLFSANLGRASRLVFQQPQRTSWSPR